jgi:hypothetical protein
MRGTVVCFTLAACARVPASPTAPTSLMPAGTCGFDAYLGDVCNEAPRFAVLTLRTSDARAAERALAAAPRIAGYPFAESFDVIPTANAKIRGIGVFAGLFRERPDADAYARSIHGEVVALGVVDGIPSDEHLMRVVVTAARTRAYAREDLERVEHELDERLAVEWTKLPRQQERRASALAKLTPICSVDADRVFVIDQHELYAFRRTYAPVTCDDGRRAWIPWRATRLESAFVGERVHQVILVECDVPTLETRAPGPPHDALGLLTTAACD